MGVLDKQITFRERMSTLVTERDHLESRIREVERFLNTLPVVTQDHKPTLNRYNLLCHNKSEVLTKIRKLKERMG